MELGQVKVKVELKLSGKGVYGEGPKENRMAKRNQKHHWTDGFMVWRSSEGLAGTAALEMLKAKLITGQAKYTSNLTRACILCIISWHSMECLWRYMAIEK